MHTDRNSILGTTGKIIAYISAFAAGALALCFFSYLQKLLVGYPQRGIGYIVPVLAGGSVGMYVKVLYVRLHNLEASTRPTAKPERLIHRVAYFITCMISGSVVLSMFSTTQKILAGYPLKPAGFVTPVLFGGATGLILGLYLHRNRQLAIQQAEANARLQQERDRIFDILSSIDDGLVVTDECNNIELVNNAAVELLEIPREEMCGKPLPHIFNRCTGDSTDGFFSPADNGKGGRTFSLLTADGSTRVVKAKITPVHNANMCTGAVILILHDTTEEYKLEQLKSEFMSTATHNLKTPITAISGYAELLLSQEDLPTEQQHEFLTYIYDKAWHLDHLIDNLLTLRRIENGRTLSLQKQPCRIEDIMAPVRKFCSTFPPQIHFKFDIEDPDTILNVDDKKIYQVMENIIDNAVKFSPNAEIVRISAQRSDNHYSISVQDEGIGMNEEEISRIFDKFYRAETNAQTSPGIGLGMSLAKQIVAAHGGIIEVHSKPHQGTTIAFHLPITAIEDQH